MIEIKPIPAFNDNYIWLIAHRQRKIAIIVDPGDAAPVLQQIRVDGLTPEAILITHHHGDHVGGINRIISEYDIPVYGPATETIPGCTHPVRDKDLIDFPGMGLQFNIMEVPGHTGGSVAYYTPGLVFVGDTLFMSGCGRLFEGNATQMYNSLNKLAQLPDDTQVYCAHEYTLANLNFALAVEPNNNNIKTRISECRTRREHHIPTVPAPLSLEKLTNPFLRTHVDDVKAAAVRYSGGPCKDNIDTFAAIRRWKDHF